MEKETAQVQIELGSPLRYRWSGKFVGKDASWKHMERTLVDYELIVMEKGTLYVEDEWQQYEVHEGEYLLMKPTRLQRGYRSSKCRFYWLHFLPLREDGFLEPLQSDGALAKESGDGRNKDKLLSFPTQGMLSNVDRVYVLMKQLQDSDLRYMDPTYNGYLATAILCEIENQMRAKDNNIRERGELVTKVDDYLLKHVGQAISVGELADQFGYNEKYFSTLFKEQTGLSVKKYVDGLKMERAKYLLLNTDALVIEIAENLGYADVQNFYHVFRKMMDCTPSEFREQYQKKQEFDR